MDGKVGFLPLKTKGEVAAKVRRTCIDDGWVISNGGRTVRWTGWRLVETKTGRRVSGGDWIGGRVDGWIVETGGWVSSLCMLEVDDWARGGDRVASPHVLAWAGGLGQPHILSSHNSTSPHSSSDSLIFTHFLPYNGSHIIASRTHLPACMLCSACHLVSPSSSRVSST